MASFARAGRERTNGQREGWRESRDIEAQNRSRSRRLVAANRLISASTERAPGPKASTMESGKQELEMGPPPTNLSGSLKMLVSDLVVGGHDRPRSS